MIGKKKVPAGAASDWMMRSINWSPLIRCWGAVEKVPFKPLVISSPPPPPPPCRIRSVEHNLRTSCCSETRQSRPPPPLINKLVSKLFSVYSTHFCKRLPEHHHSPEFPLHFCYCFDVGRHWCTSLVAHTLFPCLQQPAASVKRFKCLERFDSIIPDQRRKRQWIFHAFQADFFFFFFSRRKVASQVSKATSPALSTCTGSQLIEEPHSGAVKRSFLSPFFPQTWLPINKEPQLESRFSQGDAGHGINAVGVT